MHQPSMLHSFFSCSVGSRSPMRCLYEVSTLRPRFIFPPTQLNSMTLVHACACEVRTHTRTQRLTHHTLHTPPTHPHTYLAEPRDGILVVVRVALVDVREQLLNEARVQVHKLGPVLGCHLLPLLRCGLRHGSLSLSCSAEGAGGCVREGRLRANTTATHATCGKGK